MLTTHALPSTVPTLSARLRDETREAHRAAERGLFLRRLLRGELPKAAYAGYLAALSRVYAALEAGLRRHCELPAIAPLHWPALWRGEALARDLEALLGPDAADAVARDTAADAYVARLTALASGEPPLLVAHAYTRYLGDLSGGQILRGAVARLAPEAVAFYEFPQLADVELARRSFRARLDALPLGPRAESALVAEARAAFGLNAALLDAFA